MTEIPGEGAGLSRLRLVPAIRRARGFRLYTADGRRLVDLWQYGGRAILGHTPPAVLREMKNAAERGLFAPFPGPREGRFLKALSALLPGRSFRLFPDEAALRRFLADSGIPAAVRDPALSPAGPSASAAVPAPVAEPLPPPVLWRPFLGDKPRQSPAASPEKNAAPFLIPVLPLPWAGAPRVLAFDAAFAAMAGAGEPLSPVILAAASRAVYDLVAAIGRGRPPFPKITRALSRGGPWKRRGVYLSLAAVPGDEDYTALFRRFLDAGYLLPPSPGQPLILPGELSPGEEAKLAALLNSADTTVSAETAGMRIVP
ncbi:MAG: hypothetical protein LBP80_04375 [Treponema sp.]|nr:hypothetical protein [Treponema sp.]